MRYVKVVLMVLVLSVFVSGSVFAQNGAELFKARCAVCHLTHMPTKEQMKNLIAPTAMGVMYHIKERFKNKEDAIRFIVNYVQHPSKDKAVCMKSTIKKFGLMPSQKGVVTAEELKKIANYMWDNFPPKGFKPQRLGMKSMQAQASEKQGSANSNLTGEELAKKYGCFACHDIRGPKKAPGFAGIARRARNSSDPVAYIVRAIEHGSKGKYPAFDQAMPAYSMDKQDAEKIARWILDVAPAGGGMGMGAGGGMGMGKRRGMGKWRRIKMDNSSNQ